MLTHRDILRRNASAYAQRTAIVGPDGARLTYAELEKVTNRLARGLIGAGMQTGDRVVWLDFNSAEFLIAYYATAKIGVTFTALNAWLRPVELEPLFTLLQPTMVIVGEDLVELAEAALVLTALSPRKVLLAGCSQGWSRWDDLLAEDCRGLDTPLSEDTLHEIVFTSGTTGQSKGVMRSQRKRILDSYCAALAFELTREDHMLWFLPQFHIGGGSVPGQLLIQGGQVTILRKFEPSLAAKAIEDGITYIVGVPAHYNLMLASGVLDGVDTSRVRGCYVGGSAASRSMFEAVLSRFPNADLVHGYGSTESGPHTMALRGQAFLDHFGALGLPVPGTEARVVDPADGVDVGDDQVGELWVRSEAVMDGYLGRPDLTHAAFHDGWLRTGDLVTRDSGGWFRMVDRVKDLIITGGENVYPREVEDVLCGHPAVAEAAVIGAPDSIYEERVIAYVRLAPGDAAPDPKELIGFVRDRLAGFKTPKELYLVEDFPRTGVGKIAKAELRSSHRARVDAT